MYALRAFLHFCTSQSYCLLYVQKVSTLVLVLFWVVFTQSSHKSTQVRIANVLMSKVQT